MKDVTLRKLKFALSLLMSKDIGQSVGTTAFSPTSPASQGSQTHWCRRSFSALSGVATLYPNPQRPSVCMRLERHISPLRAELCLLGILQLYYFRAKLLTLGQGYVMVHKVSQGVYNTAK